MFFTIFHSEGYRNCLRLAIHLAFVPITLTSAQNNSHANGVLHANVQRRRANKPYPGNLRKGASRRRSAKLGWASTTNCLCNQHCKTRDSWLQPIFCQLWQKPHSVYGAIHYSSNELTRRWMKSPRNKTSGGTEHTTICRGSYPFGRRKKQTAIWSADKSEELFSGRIGLETFIPEIISYRSTNEKTWDEIRSLLRAGGTRSKQLLTRGCQNLICWRLSY